MQASVSGVELSPVCTCVPPSKGASKNTGDSKGQLQDRLGSEGIHSRCVQGWAELATGVDSALLGKQSLPAQLLEGSTACVCTSH